MTTKQTKPASKASKPASKTGKPDPIVEMEAKLKELEAQNKALEAEKEALADRLKPHKADKAAFYEADSVGLARHAGATDKAVTYAVLSPEGTLTMAEFLLARFGTAAFTAKHAAEEMANGMLGAGGTPKYQGKDPVGSARINGWQRANNAVRHNTEIAPWERVGGSGRAEIFRLTEDGIARLSVWVKAGNPHRWPNS